jgi:hypothetical protein
MNAKVVNSHPLSKKVQTSSFDIGTHKHEKPQQAILLESIPSILGQIEDIDRLIVEIPSAEYSKSTRSIVVTKKAVEEGKLPVIRFQLANGVELALSPKDYVVRKINRNGELKGILNF